MPSLIAQAADILGELPDSENQALSLLQQKAIDQGDEWLATLDDLSSLIEAMLVLDGKSIHVIPDPSNRIGSLIKMDQWEGCDEMIALIKKCKKDGWILRERKTSFNLERAGKVQIKIGGLREANLGGLSIRIILPRVKTLLDLDVYLNTLDLKEFLTRVWSTSGTYVNKGSEVQGRYFFFHEIHRIMDKITERLPNDKQTKKLAGFKPNKVRNGSNGNSTDS